MSDSSETVSAKDTEEVIMEATFRALSKHGYTDLRMRDIGEEMDLTRQVIHYHFDGKYDLMSSFLEYVIEQYEGSVQVDEETDPRSELDARIDQCLFGPEFEEFTHWDRMKVYHELYTYAQNDGEHRDFRRPLRTYPRKHRRGRRRRNRAGPVPIGRRRTNGTVDHRRHPRCPRTADLTRSRRRPEETRRAIDEFILDSLHS